MRVAGFVLAGGKSRRMGFDKALLPYRETVLAAWVFRQVEAAAGRAFLVGDPGGHGILGLPQAEEYFPGLGPLSGIHAALKMGLAEWNLVVACDMPGLSLPWLERVVRETEQAAADAVVTRDALGRPEPLCAAYHRRLLGKVEEALREGRLSVQELLQHIDVEWLTVDSSATVTNVNTPEEWVHWKS